MKGCHFLAGVNQQPPMNALVKDEAIEAILGMDQKTCPKFLVFSVFYLPQKFFPPSHLPTSFDFVLIP
jgi:hypothetical protein